MNPLGPEFGAWAGGPGPLVWTLAAVTPVDVVAADQVAVLAGEPGRILALVGASRGHPANADSGVPPQGRRGTDDMSSIPAMTREQATAALEAGIDVVEGLVAEGVEAISGLRTLHGPGTVGGLGARGGPGPIAPGGSSRPEAGA